MSKPHIRWKFLDKQERTDFTQMWFTRWMQERTRAEAVERLHASDLGALDVLTRRLAQTEAALAECERELGEAFALLGRVTSFDGHNGNKVMAIRAPGLWEDINRWLDARTAPKEGE